MSHHREQSPAAARAAIALSAPSTARSRPPPDRRPPHRRPSGREDLPVQVRQAWDVPGGHPVRFQNSAHPVFVEQAAEDGPTSDPSGWFGRDRLVGSWRAKLPPAMRPVAVVVPGVHGEHVPEVPFTEDQHPVGDFGPGGEHEPLGVGVRPGTARRILRVSMPASASTVSKALVNRPARSRIR
jgi:hypothetical protein